MIRRLFVIGLVLVAIPAGADERDLLGGRIEARLGEETVVFPSLSSEIDADVTGDLATVTVVQTFVNPHATALHATYLFPLAREAAVFSMTMEVGDEIVRAKIQRVEEARRTFETAKREGRAASLLVQHRPNMFTQDVANLMPGLPIRVTLRYVQTVPRVDGAYELVIPLVVGPRFQPPGAGVAPRAEPFDRPDAATSLPASPAAPQLGGGVPRWNPANPPATEGGANEASSRAPFGQWEVEALPAYPPVRGLDLPPEIDPARVALQVEIDGGMPIRAAESPTHAIATAVLEPEVWRVALDGGRTIDNRDFVLRYALAGDRTEAGLLAYRDDRGGFFSLLLEPPAAPADEDVTPREMVFVLDCSGSMAGLPVEASKAFMRAALYGLRPTDSFRIIRFSDAATEFSGAPLPATPDNVARGLRYTDALRGSGGTMMTSGVRQAFLPPVPEGAIRIVVFLTDGYIGNETEVLRLLAEERGDARLFAFGVGTAVNRFLLDEMGRIGRGFTRYMDPTERIDEVASELAMRLDAPVLTDIEIDWGDLGAARVSPARVPDLFAGDSIRIQGRYGEPGIHDVRITGRVRGRPATLPLRIDLPEVSEGGEAVALLWARSEIREAMRLLATPTTFRPAGATDDVLKEHVVDLGLDFSLVTKWTSFVAVSEKIVNLHPGHAETKPVPLPMVEGITHLAYGEPVAHATPEPGELLGLALAITLATFFLLDRARRRARSGCP